MQPSDQERWKQEVVELVFCALARRPALIDHLVFKGGQVGTENYFEIVKNGGRV